MQSIFGFFSGSSFGYFAASFFSGPSEGMPGLIGPVLFNLGNWELHFHHWLISLLLFLAFFFLRKKIQISSLCLAFVMGFLIGLIFQGIFVYDDWHRILIQKI